MTVHRLDPLSARRTLRPHHRHTNAKFRVVCGKGFLPQKRMATRVLGNINNIEVQGSQLRTKRIIIIIVTIIATRSGAPLLILGLAKSIYYTH